MEVHRRLSKTTTLRGPPALKQGLHDVTLFTDDKCKVMISFKWCSTDKYRHILLYTSINDHHKTFICFLQFTLWLFQCCASASWAWGRIHWPHLRRVLCAEVTKQLQAVRVTQWSSNRGSGVTSLCGLGPQGHAVHVNHVLSYTHTYANFLTKA